MQQINTAHNTKPTIMRGLATRPPIPSNRGKRDKVDSCADGDPIEQRQHQQQPSRKPLPSYHHYWPLHHLHHPEHMRGVRRRGAPDTVTASTTSVLSASSLNERSAAAAGRPPPSSRGGRFPRLMGGFRRKRSGRSESQLRKTARKHAERGDWPALRKLISGHKFPDVPEVDPKRLGGTGEQPAAGGGIVQQDPTARRPSYGSRTSGEGRRSFTRDVKSAAAAAVIREAMLEESSEETGGDPAGTASSSSSRRRRNPLADHRLDFGENILHDLCRFHPPLDVVETLLAALHHRPGCTIGTDDAGRTPLHVAAECGAGSDVIRALVQADPTPASRGDVHRRSPLHLAMRYCVFHYQPNMGHHQPTDKMLLPEEVLEETFQVVQVLKEAMLDYPGRIGFKDEDASGYSPLDYAIDGDISTEELIQALVRRRDPRRLRSSSPHPKSAAPARRRPFSRKSSSTSSVCSLSTGTGGDLDIEVLQRLEMDEIEARRHRIAKMKARCCKERINNPLFDVFGIQEQPPPVDPPSAAAIPVATAAKSAVCKSEMQARVEDSPTAKSPVKSSVKATAKAPAKAPAREDDKPLVSDADIYNRHLQDYLDGYLEDFGGLLDQGDDDDGFDIFEDPELVEPPPPPTRKSSPPPARESGGPAPPVCEIAFTWVDDDCASLASEISVLVD